MIVIGVERKKMKEKIIINPPYETAYHVVVGYHLRRDINLTAEEKVLAYELLGLHDVYGKYITNEAICYFTNQKTETIAPMLARLQQLGYVEVEGDGFDRTITLLKPING